MNDDWRERVWDQVTEKNTRAPGAKTIAVFFPPEWYTLVRDVAKMRGLPLGGYVRRATMAFVAHDLGLDYDELMQHEPLLRIVGDGPRPRDREGARKKARDRGHGAWRILGLR